MAKHHSENFESYVAKLKKNVKTTHTQFTMLRNLCGHRTMFDDCAHDGHVPRVFCKLENCPLLR